MAKKEKATKVRRGPHAPAGKAPLQILVAEKTIEEAKIKVIRGKTNVSGSSRNCCRVGWTGSTR